MTTENADGTITLTMTEIQARDLINAAQEMGETYLEINMNDYITEYEKIEAEEQLKETHRVGQALLDTAMDMYEVLE